MFKSFALMSGLCIAVLSPAAVGAETVQAATPNVMALFPHTTSRPLFSKSRRPVVKAKVVVVAPEPKPVEQVVKVAAVEPDPVVPKLDPASWRLLGVIKRDSRSIAMLTHRPSGKTHLLGLGRATLPADNGQDIEVSVQSITSDSVLISDGRKLRLTLRDPSDQIGVEQTEPVAKDPQWAGAVKPADTQLVVNDVQQVASLLPTGVATSSKFTISSAPTE